MAATRTPRSRWIEQGLQALAFGGPASVRVERLAKALGITKGGFYWHFEDRGALLAEMLDAWERQAFDDVVEQVEAGSGDARAKIARLFDLASSGGGTRRVDLAVRNWARHEPDIARRLRRVDNRRMAYLRSLYGTFCPDESDVEARCLLTMALYVGVPLLATDHGERTRAEVLDLALKRLLS